MSKYITDEIPVSFNQVSVGDSPFLFKNTVTQMIKLKNISPIELFPTLLLIFKFIHTGEWRPGSVEWMSAEW